MSCLMKTMKMDDHKISVTKLTREKASYCLSCNQENINNMDIQKDLRKALRENQVRHVKDAVMTLLIKSKGERIF